MIKITSFYPFQNFMRITQDFYEDKAVVEIKSLTLEHEYEFEYKDVFRIAALYGKSMPEVVSKLRGESNPKPGKSRK